ncbi:MAG: 50S ribosomal protein L1 [Calditrichaeota bacterium]|nr:50S ribosomal protein L1 [Calditrichota bacterium]MCB9368596.1 50S ribosomal protein L1 [Calditrichota bacterium]
MPYSKRVKKNREHVNRNTEMPLSDAINSLKSTSHAKFNETVEVAVRLGVDPKKADQIVRGTVVLPHGTGKTVRVVAVTKTKISEAQEAGADHAGFEDLLERIKGGWTDFDVLVATPEVMADLGKLGKILGPRGLMPNPKAGTVTPNIGNAVRDVKGGKVEFRVDKYGILHLGVGRLSFTNAQLYENIEEFFKNIMRNKPATAKGQYVKSVFLTSTMGPGIRVQRSEVESAKLH